MLDSWLAPGKLGAPVPGSTWCERELAPPGRPLPPVVLLSAGPGYGKTLGMLALSRRSAGPLVWLTLDAFDADVATFFHYLVAGMRAHIPEFGQGIEGMLMGSPPEPRLLWQRFFQETAVYNLPGFVLALDDFHHLCEGEAPIARALASFFDKLPPGVRLLLASRRRFPFPLARFQARGQVLLLEQDVLRFDDQEAIAFMRARAPGEDIPAAWRQQAAVLEGWPLGLELVTSDVDLSPGRAGSGGLLTEYVAEELFAGLAATDRAFMLRAGLLDELTVAACTAVCGPDAPERLASLDDQHLLQRFADGHLYRFAPYLRDFLRQEASRKLAPGDLAALHAAAAGHLLAAGQQESAIPHALAAGDWPGALSACSTLFPRMRFDGRRGQILRWLEAFPENVARSEPDWLLWRAHCHAYAGEQVEALTIYQSLRDRLVKSGDRAGAFKALVCVCNSLQVQDLREALATGFEQAMAELADALPEDRADFLLLQAFEAELAGDLEQMRAANEAILQVGVGQNVDIAMSHCIALMNLYTSALHTGDLDRAGRHAGHLCELAGQWRFYPLALYASFLQAYLQICRGQIEEAATFVRGLPGEWNERLHWHDRGVAHTILGYFHQARGDFKEAEAELNRSVAVFEQADFKEGVKVPLERMAWLAISRRQYARVETLLAEVLADGETNIYDLALLLPRARARHLAASPQEAVALFERALPALERMGAALHLARGRLYLAASYRATGDREKAQEALAGALSLAEAHGYGFLRQQDQSLWDELGPFLDDSPIPDVAVRPAAEAPLELSCLGSFEVRLAGVRLDQWPRKKTKLILAALALHPRGLAATDLATLIGESGEQAANLIRVNMVALRRALEPRLERREASRFVKLADDRYTLEWQQVGAFDVQRFDRSLADGNTLAGTEPVEAAHHFEEALGAYRGNLLSEPFFASCFEPEREHYRKQALKACRWLEDFHRRRGDFTGAIAVTTRAAEIAPCEEETYLTLIRLHQERKRPDRARQAYWDCRKAFKAHLAMAPSDEFEVMARTLFAS